MSKRDVLERCTQQTQDSPLPGEKGAICKEHTYQHGLKNTLHSANLETLRTLSSLKRFVAITGSTALTAGWNILRNLQIQKKNLQVQKWFTRFLLRKAEIRGLRVIPLGHDLLTGCWQPVTSYGNRFFSVVVGF